MGGPRRADRCRSGRSSWAGAGGRRSGLVEERDVGEVRSNMSSWAGSGAAGGTRGTVRRGGAPIGGPHQAVECFEREGEVANGFTRKCIGRAGTGARRSRAAAQTSMGSPRSRMIFAMAEQA
eukprot:16427505-Heterocapsa_arctica.AAC.1